MSQVGQMSYVTNKTLMYVAYNILQPGYNRSKQEGPQHTVWKPELKACAGIDITR